MTTCVCQQTIDAIKLAAREGIVKELNHQLAQKERQIEKLQLEIYTLRESMRVSYQPQSKPLIRLGDY